MNDSLFTRYSFEFVQLTRGIVKCLSNLLFTQGFSVTIHESYNWY